MAAIPKKFFIFVLGSHRSGTSALARLMNSMGVFLGDTLLEPQKGVNETGFWENSKVVGINERIFARLGSAWYDTRPLPAGWDSSPAMDDIRSDIRAFLASEFSGRPIAGIKDPRLCRLLPLWLPLVQEAGWTPVSLVIYRSIGSSSRSLTKRDGFSVALSKLVWLVNNMEVELNTRALKSAYIDYDYLVSAPGEMTKNIRKFFQEIPLSESGEKPSLIIDGALNHSGKTSLHDVENPDEYDMIGMEIADNFKGGANPELRARMDHIRKSFHDYFADKSIGDLIFEQSTRYVHVNQDLSRIGMLHSHAQAVVQERDRTIRLMQAELAAVQQRSMECESQVNAQHGQLAMLQEKLREARASVPAVLSAAARVANIPADEAARLIEGREKQLEDAKSTLAKRTEELRAALVKVKDLTIKLGDQQALVGVVEAELEVVRQKSAACEESLRKFSGLMAEKDREIAGFLGESGLLKEESLRQSGVIADLCARLRASQDVLARMDRKITDLESTIRQCRQAEKELRGKVDELQAGEQYFDREFLQLSGELERYKAILAEREDLLARHEAAQENHDAQVALLTARLGEKEREVNDLNGRFFYLRTRFLVRLLAKLGIYRVPNE